MLKPFMRRFQRRSQDTSAIPPLTNPPTCDDIGGAYPRVGHNWQAPPPRSGATFNERAPYQPSIPDDLMRTAEVAAVRLVVSIIGLAAVIALAYLGLAIMDAQP